MNKRERLEICRLVAEWEWAQGGSSAGASERGRCAKELVESFDLSSDDLNFARAWEIAGLAGIRDDIDIFDEFLDMFDDVGYESVIDLVERVGFEDLHDAIALGK